MKFKHMKEPCGPNDVHKGCPFRVDTPPGEFCSTKYEDLRDTIGSDDAPVLPGAPMFACHKTTEGHEVACAGWLATFGQHHMSVRLAVNLGALPLEATRPQPGWPELHTNYEEVIAKGHEPYAWDDFAECPTCSMQPGRPCFDIEGRMPVMRQEPHSERNLLT